MKKCFKCRRRKPISEFYVHPMMADGRLGKCKSCTRKDVAEWYGRTREKRAEYERKRFNDPKRKEAVREYMRRHRERYRGKTRARAAVANAVRDGRIKKLACEVCGSKKSQAHHPDYRKPLRVRWLCFRHHREAHGQVVIRSPKR